mmetsp:Transcript_26204/g.57635  ORF Transcript_26204/g.57635 Transcript_26204/m.57635 type:complete len:526 (-) Transcript_26204:307-1884(-)
MGFLSVLHVALLAASAWRSVAVTTFSQNQVCRQNQCVNPLFPGLSDLGRLEAIQWQCMDGHVLRPLVKFCKHAVNYDAAVPSPSSNISVVQDLVNSQDDAASTMFFYHLHALGYDAWEHQNPGSIVDPCVKSVYNMACYTVFPKQEIGCTPGQLTKFLRPCAGTCGSYLSSCKVECCDESVQCVFQETVDMGGNVSMIQSGYVDEVGPSAICTGSGSRSRAGDLPWALLISLLGLHLLPGRQEESSQVAAKRKAASTASASGSSIGRWPLAGLLMGLAISLQGCDVPHHKVGNWRSKRDYLADQQVETKGQAVLNTCTVKDLDQTLQCSGRGYCKAWDLDSASSKLAFCACDRDWTGPECKQRRKSQAKAFFISLFGGIFGLDYFYLGLMGWGIVKFLSLGGLGFWWLFDVVRIGCGPIYAHDYRLARDLPHWVFVLITLVLFLLAGFMVSLASYIRYRKMKREDCMKLHESEESHHNHEVPELMGPHYTLGAEKETFSGRRGHSDYSGYGGYGATLNMHSRPLY